MRSTAFTLTILAVATVAEASSPALSIIMPRGVQRGADTEVTMSGARLNDAEEILFYRPGVTATKITPVNANAIKVNLKVAADCRLGEHIAQVRTKSGISEYRTFWVGPFAGVDEKEPNNEFDAPQPITAGVTVHGVAANEDVDYYMITAKKGQRISAEVEAMRLGTTMFDPYVAILDAKRFELSAADDMPLLYQDGAASAIAPEDGQYIIEVRESAYAGNNACRYRLHVGHFPRPTAVYPAGGKIGEEVAVKFIGDPTGDFEQKFKLPAAVEDDYGVLAADATGTATSENVFRLFEHGNSMEVEPNEDFKTASSATLPNAFNGIIEKDGDVDCFKFAAKKGQVYEVECYARRIRSGLDPVMNLYYANGRRITGNDDSRGPDSYFRFSVPADGEYILRINDHLSRGRKDFVYRVEFQPIKQKLTLGIPRVARYSQYRQTIYVPKGNRFATLITASRANFGGDLVFDGKDLPAGIAMHTETMPANMNTWPIVFEAKADAATSGKLLNFTARHADEKTGIRGGFANTADMIISRPGQSRYWNTDVKQLAVAVVDELPFKLEIVQPKVPIVRNGAMNLKVVATKKAGWDEAITLEFPFRPPGISANSRITMPKGKNEVMYPLNANGSAAIRKWPIYVIGQSNVNGAAWVSSQLASLEIAAPYVTFALDRTAVEQGKETEILVKVNQAQAFEGKAKARLVGLPNKVASAELEFTKDTKELVFKVTTDKASPAGRHKSVYAQVELSMHGEPIVHRHVGGTELRIDKPLPPPKKPVKPKPAPKKVAKKPEPKKAAPPRRLTRLEQLRLEAKKRAEEAGGGSE